MPLSLFAADALTAEGWRRDVRIDVDSRGTIVAVQSDATSKDAERVAGPLLPGMPNLHSHAFQRALAGRTGRAASDGDSFWTWRSAMYSFLDKVDADAFAEIAAQAYVEMLKAGYTRVAEFHYVHHDPHGNPYGDPAELSRRIVDAASATGIGLTLLPVFYAHSAFGGAPPNAGQRRFIQSLDSYAQLVEALAQDAARSDWNLGVAPHSLRAVTPEELAAVVAIAPPGAPIHIHAAEQQKEVADCIAWSGKQPIAWLLDHANLDARWCVVHATHMTTEETRGLAASEAIAGLAPTTEADLGDGTFAARAYLDAGGAFGVGSDSNTILDPYAELRQLEWSQRLAQRARNVLAIGDLPVGHSLYVAAARGGARATAVAAGMIAPGSRADLVVLDPMDAALAEQDVDTLLDTAIFGPCRRAVRDVMVGGHWVVRDGHHADEDEVHGRYRRTVAALRQ